MRSSITELGITQLHDRDTRPLVTSDLQEGSARLKDGLRWGSNRVSLFVAAPGILDAAGLEIGISLTGAGLTEVVRHPIGGWGRVAVDEAGREL